MGSLLFAAAAAAAADSLLVHSQASAVHPSSIDAISYTFASPLMTNQRGSPVKCESFDAVFKKQ